MGARSGLCREDKAWPQVALTKKGRTRITQIYRTSGSVLTGERTSRFREGMGISRLEAAGIRNKGSKVRESTQFGVSWKGLKRLLAQEGDQ